MKPVFVGDCPYEILLLESRLCTARIDIRIAVFPLARSGEVGRSCAGSATTGAIFHIRQVFGQRDGQTTESGQVLPQLPRRQTRRLRSLPRSVNPSWISLKHARYPIRASLSSSRYTRVLFCRVYLSGAPALLSASTGGEYKGFACPLSCLIRCPLSSRRFFSTCSRVSLYLFSFFSDASRHTSFYYLTNRRVLPHILYELSTR